jgi:hypothetical protein
MGKPVNGYTVNAKKEGTGRQGWHFEIHNGVCPVSTTGTV